MAAILVITSGTDGTEASPSGTSTAARQSVAARRSAEPALETALARQAELSAELDTVKTASIALRAERDALTRSNERLAAEVDSLTRETTGLNRELLDLELALASVSPPDILDGLPAHMIDASVPVPQDDTGLDRVIDAFYDDLDGGSSPDRLRQTVDAIAASGLVEAEELRAMRQELASLANEGSAVR